MSWKKTDLERLRGASINDRMSKSAPPVRYGSGSAFVSRREQRRLDQARGLVPFAVKLPEDLVRRVQARAQERGQGLGDAVAELLENGLEAISKR